jgi:DNA repair protein RecO (recombination protein O)
VSLYSDEGVVLRTIRLGEADRIVSFATAEHGKVRAVAKGVRKTTSRFGARLEPATRVRMLCWRGRELDVVSQAQVVEGFRRTRESLGRLAKAYAMLEVVDQLAPERVPVPELYAMLVGALGVLEADDPAMVVPAFILKVLVSEGSAPVLDMCVACGCTSALVAFDLGQGGALCRSCRRGRPVSGEALALMRLVLGGKLREALGEPEGALASEVAEITTEAIEHHLERRVRSLHTNLQAHSAPREPLTQEGDAPGR